MNSERLKLRMKQFQEDMRQRVKEEYAFLNDNSSPSDDNEIMFIKNLRWESPELANYVKKEFDNIKRH
jgi:hypothetical protein